MIQPCETGKAWMAGFIDGEGWIGIIHRRYQPCIGVGNTSIDSLQILASNYGGVIRRIIPSEDGRSRKVCYYWRCPAENILQFLLDLHPYLIVKKEQCECVMFLLRNRVCHKPLWPEDIAFREKLYIEAKELNNGGNHGQRIL